MSIFDGTFLDGIENWIVSFLQYQVFFAPILLLIIEEAGIPLPVENVIFIHTGYQVAKGNLPFLVAYIILLGSIVIGASILYYLSSRYGQRLIFKFGKYMHLSEDKLFTVQNWFKKYGVWFIIFGRHIPGFRVPITVFSGMSHITYRTFILCILISDAFTIPFYLTLGMKFGPKAAGLLHAHQGYVIFLVSSAILVALGVLFLRMSKSVKDNMQKVHTQVSRISKFVLNSEAALFLFLEMALGILISLASFLFFIDIVKDVIEKDYVHFDTTISLFMYSMRSPLLTQIMFALSSFGGVAFLLIATVITILFFLYKKYYREALLFSFILFMGEIIDFALKIMVKRPRPHFHPLVIEHDYSFPSGHSMGAFIFYVTLAYMIFHFTKNKKLSLTVFSCAILLTFLIGVSRVYLGVHYPSDVLAGFVAGAFWFATVILLDKTMIFLKLFKKYEKIK